MTLSAGPILGVIFDLDGVLVTTDELHFRAWKEIADREGIPFTRHDNERLRGVSRMESLSIILEKSPRVYGELERVGLAEHKNARYREMLGALTPADLLPGARELLTELRRRTVHTAIGSSSRNAREIADRLDIRSLLDAIVDGNDIRRSKPDPEVFQTAADRIGLLPTQCVVVEDAESGVAAALRGGFHVVGIGEPSRLPMAHRHAPAIGELGLDQALKW